MGATSTEENAAGVPGKVFAVVGATGQQGGATARALLAAGAGVRALVRDPQAGAAQALQQQGAQLARADLQDADSLRGAFTGVDGVFAMTTFAGPRGTQGEVEHGRLIGNAARHTGIPHFESKRRVEEHLASLGRPVTIVRPTFFMDNFNRSGLQEQDGVLVLRSPLTPGVPLQMVAVDDIGAVAAVALLDPDRVPGGSIEIAGDELTGEQIADAFGQQARLPARFEPLPLAALANDPDLQAMFTWFTRLPAYQADFAATRELHPGVHDLPAWLATTVRPRS